jgi:hypothetical protein
MKAYHNGNEARAPLIRTNAFVLPRPRQPACPLLQERGIRHEPLCNTSMLRLADLLRLGCSGLSIPCFSHQAQAQALATAVTGLPTYLVLLPGSPAHPRATLSARLSRDTVNDGDLTRHMFWKLVELCPSVSWPRQKAGTQQSTTHPVHPFRWSFSSHRPGLPLKVSGYSPTQVARNAWDNHHDFAPAQVRDNDIKLTTLPAHVSSRRFSTAASL